MVFGSADSFFMNTKNGSPEDNILIKSQMIHRILERTVSQSMGTRELKLLLQHIKHPKSELVDLQSDNNIVSTFVT